MYLGDFLVWSVGLDRRGFLTPFPVCPDLVGSRVDEVSGLIGRLFRKRLTDLIFKPEFFRGFVVFV